MNRSIKLLALTLALGAPLLAPATAAAADTGADVPSLTVRYDDLNLGNKQGVKTLHHRIERAAQDVCGPSARGGSRVQSIAWRDCVSTAVAGAVAAVDQPALSAYHAANYPDAKRLQGISARAAVN
jgi:UrcA family protein